ncbi:MAG: PspC domain-containing protein [Bacteroidales bacterium]|jgi:phage shock protein C|nr:PspC domain-containing protein [Bacteroidales bacterium]
MDKKFVRTKDKRIAGVCSGIAKYFNIDPLIVRAVFLAMIFLGGSGLFIYLILMIIMPYEDDVFTDYIEIDGDEVKQEEPAYSETDIKNIKKRALNMSALIVGLLLILVGIFFFLRNFFPFLRFSYWFPLLLALVGILLVLTSVKSKKN